MKTPEHEQLLQSFLATECSRFEAPVHPLGLREKQAAGRAIAHVLAHTSDKPPLSGDLSDQEWINAGCPREDADQPPTIHIGTGYESVMTQPGAMLNPQGEEVTTLTIRQGETKVRLTFTTDRHATEFLRLLVSDTNPAPLAAKHNGMRIAASGVLNRVGGHLKFGAREMLKHLEQMGERFYAGDLTAVDEFLQLYCLDEKRPAQQPEGQ